MSTIHTMNIALADIEARVVRELQFSADAKLQIADHIDAVRTAVSLVNKAVDELERSVSAAFQERTRALSAVIGSGKVSPETLEGTTTESESESESEPPAPRKPKLVKQQGGES